MVLTAITVLLLFNGKYPTATQHVWRCQIGPMEWHRVGLCYQLKHVKISTNNFLPRAHFPARFSTLGDPLARVEVSDSHEIETSTLTAPHPDRLRSTTHNSKWPRSREFCPGHFQSDGMDADSSFAEWKKSENDDDAPKAHSDDDAKILQPTNRMSYLDYDAFETLQGSKCDGWRRWNNTRRILA